MAKNNSDAMNAGLIYIGRREIHPGKGSSIRKLIRGARIAAGLRPLRRKKRQYFPVGIHIRDGERFLVSKAADLHFTKGYRVAVGVPLKISKIPAPVAPSFADAFPDQVDPRGISAVAA